MPIETITVEGTILDHENLPLGGRRVVGTPLPAMAILSGGEVVSLTADTWTDAAGHFSLVCIKATGTVYTIQTRPEKRLFTTIELRSDDWPAGSVVQLSALPMVIPPGVIPGETLAELKAELLAYINVNLRPRLGVPFSDPRLALTVGAGDMRYPNETSRVLNLLAVGLDVQIAPTGTDLIIDVNRNGTTIFTDQAHRPRIAAGAFEGGSVLIDSPAFGPTDYLTVDIDQIGSISAGGHLTVTVVLEG